jgi:hypothetical protein
LKELIRGIVRANVDKFVMVEIKIVEREVDSDVVESLLEGCYQRVCPGRFAASLEAC